jgi:LAS superfamily LD-carboxypeptidase LdcB
MPPWQWAAGAALLGGAAYLATHLAQAYEEGRPTGLALLSAVDGVELEWRAAGALRRMQAAARAEDVELRPTSGFRRMGEQQRLWDDLQAGRRTAAVARPGTSNHQRGRVDRARKRGPAVDVAVSGAGSRVDVWLEKNAAKFGFDRSEGKAVSEPWHLVYLGE